MPGVMHTVTGNEIPLVLLAVFAGSAALLVISDDAPDPTATAAGVAVSALVALGLFWVQLRARRAQPALDKDLHDALGARWRSQASTPSTSPTPAARSGLAWRHGILLPFGRRRPGVERWRDLRYGPDARAPARRVPGLRPGDGAAGRRASARRRIRPGREESREPGASAAARRTRLMRHQRELPTSRRRSVPRSQLDVARVIAWVAEHADRLGVDTRQIYGYLGPRGADPSSSPTYRIRPDASSPVMIVHGARDTALAPAQARAVAATIRAASSSPVRRRRAARDAARIRPVRPAQAITRRPPRSAPPGAHARGPRRSDRRGPLDVGERLT